MYIEDVNYLLLESIAANLSSEGLDNGLIEKYMQNARDIVYTKTSDRSTIGQMNDMVYLATAGYLSRHLEADRINQVEVNKKLNRVPMVKWKYKYGIDGFKEEILKL